MATSEAGEKIAEAAKILRAAHHPIFLSGAGISAESGIPTFRSGDSSRNSGTALWEKYRAEATRGREPDVATPEAATMASLRPEELATPEAFARDPGLVWQWYNWRKRLISEKQPNPAHHAAAELARLLPDMLCLTQNVDGFHALAGLENILEMHGNIYRTRCTSCGSVHQMRSEVNPTTLCPACGRSPLRPDIVWFGEALPRAIMQTIHERLAIADAILVVGTSGSVYPAAGFAVEVRRRRGHVLEINVDEKHRPFTGDIYLHGPAGVLLPQLVAAVKKE